MRQDLIKLSKKLSYVLRHRPDSIGLSLDKEGWARLDELFTLMMVDGTPLTISQLQELVRENDKQRFALSADGSKIRASQGHSNSLGIDLGLKASLPPARLYHGTQTSALPDIHKKGLLPMSRSHVHLSADKATAEKVALRRGPRITILEINAERMNSSRLKFYKSENGVWLTDEVPAEYITFPK